MKGDLKKTTIWQRMRHQYRISIINEKTLAEHGHIRINIWGVIVLLSTLFVIVAILLTLTILFTPMRNYLPGYSANIRHQLMQESAKIDSLGADLEVQRQYLTLISQAVAGEVPTDSIHSLDSMQIIAKEQILTTKSQIEKEFIAQYESEEKEYLQLFQPVKSTNTTHTNNFMAPTHGSVLTTFSSEDRQYSIVIKSYGSNSASVVLDGTIIHSSHDFNDSYTVVVQHAQFTSIYRGLDSVTKKVGQQVTTGQVIGIIKDQELEFELWQNGKAVNPQDYIVF
jgi:hypothetical protein